MRAAHCSTNGRAASVTSHPCRPQEKQVIETTTDELSRADEAFAGNRLLSTMTREARALIEPYGDMVDLSPGETVLQRGVQPKAACSRLVRP